MPKKAGGSLYDSIDRYLLLICLAILVRGGGALSVDRALGREV